MRKAPEDNRSRFTQGTFIPKNPKKLIGKPDPFYRSAWELTIMQFFDTSPSVLQWASEAIKIPYKNPFNTREMRQYIPDFLVVYIDKRGKTHAELIEVKPKKETLAEFAKSRRDKSAQILNSAKWEAAIRWCQKNNIKFNILTEDQIYRNKGKR